MTGFSCQGKEEDHPSDGYEVDSFTGIHRTGMIHSGERRLSSFIIRPPQIQWDTMIKPGTGFVLPEGEGDLLQSGTIQYFLYPVLL
ncbi:MAG: hypothetical protein LUQ37_11065 [Methanoregulaceae archaeon]|nr:hypothetical protein [Methanoregulaceae archaeon]